jgi:APA family basic amino acid/polyamine antiporter
MVAFAVMSSGITSASSAALAFGKTYLQSVVKEFFSDSVAVPTTLVAALFIAGLAVVNFRGVSESVKANVVLTCIELSGLLIVFAVVNVAVLVLRKETVEHQHFRAPTIVPVLGAVSCAYLASPLSGRPWEDYRIAGYLLLAGLVLWLINRVVHGKTEFRAESLSE